MKYTVTFFINNSDIEPLNAIPYLYTNKITDIGNIRMNIVYVVVTTLVIIHISMLDL